MISVALLLYPGLGLALSECKQWHSNSSERLALGLYYRQPLTGIADELTGWLAGCVAV